MKVTEVFTDSYAPAYDELWIHHPNVEAKNRFNVAAIGALLSPLGTWLDTCCGQGWQLAQFPHQRRMGLDLSAAQLERARQANPGVDFIEADVLTYEFPDARRFDLVTNLFGASCYMKDEEEMRALLRKLVGWTAPGGALYMELVSPDIAQTYPDSSYARDGHVSVTLLSPDGVRWNFRDAGGVHDMISLPPDFFADLIAPHFADVDTSVVLGPVRMLIARRKKAD